MDLILLDKDFTPISIIDDFASLVWNRKYYDVGNFTLQLPISQYENVKNAMYVYSNEFVETGKIETLNYVSATSEEFIKLSGRFLEVLLNDRVINKTKSFNACIEDICLNLVNEFAINTTDIKRKINKLKVKVLETRNINDKLNTQVTGDNLLEYLYTLTKSKEKSIRITYDYINDELIFEVWQGLDRTDSQNENSWAIFSRNFENIAEDDYSLDSTKYKNYVYIAGQDKGENRIIVELDLVKNGEERKELYVDARDLQMEDGMTLSQYKEILLQRGLEKLYENNKVEKSDFKIDPFSNLIYKKDFDLGDKATYKNEDLGIFVDKRIVEISEVYENGNKEINVTFGDDYNIRRMKGVS